MTHGKLAAASGFPALPVVVCQSARGFYLGTKTDDGPVSRESEEYYGNESDAEQALDTGSWTQRSYA
jgi:hypothetical protein